MCVSLCPALTQPNPVTCVPLCQEETLKAAVHVCWCVRSLAALEQSGGIGLSGLEAQLESLLESVVTFNPPGESSSSFLGIARRS